MITTIEQLLEIYNVKSEKELDWENIPRFQTLSKEFIIKHWELIPILSLVKECGNKKRKIYRLKESPELIRIGCFRGTKEETIEAIQKKYGKKPFAMQQYIHKVEECFNTTLID